MDEESSYNTVIYSYGPPPPALLSPRRFDGSSGCAHEIVSLVEKIAIR